MSSAAHAAGPTTTLGIDLAAESTNTGACAVAWDGRGGARVLWARTGSTAAPLDNAELLRLVAEADAVGIDAPFGWPRRFVAALAAWDGADAWTEPWEPETRRDLRLRATDRWIAEQPGQTRGPLSVSADSIAVCAMRACALLAATGRPVDRVGGPLYEVYPAAALRAWGLARPGYKRDAAVREALLAELAGGWLDAAAARAEVVRTDHAFDALLSALVARAAQIGRVAPVPADLRGAARTEGWIQLPAGPLSALAGAPPI